LPAARTARVGCATWWPREVLINQRFRKVLTFLATRPSCSFDSAFQKPIRKLFKGRELTDERNAELGTLTVQAFTRVRKAADTEAFLFLSEANAALDLIRKEWETDRPSWQEHLDAMQFTSRRCVTRIVALSKRDLKLQRHLLTWS
jgi:hypothetical protein